MLRATERLQHKFPKTIILTPGTPPPANRIRLSFFLVRLLVLRPRGYHHTAAPPQAPRIRLASWMSFCMMVTLLAWMAHKLTSSKRWTRKASAASCRAWIACDCHLNSSPIGLKLIATSRTCNPGVSIRPFPGAVGVESPGVGNRGLPAGQRGASAAAGRLFFDIAGSPSAPWFLVDICISCLGALGRQLCAHDQLVGIIQRRGAQERLPNSR